jgi:hypothetical protein
VQKMYFVVPVGKNLLALAIGVAAMQNTPCC